MAQDPRTTNGSPAARGLGGAVGAVPGAVLGATFGAVAKLRGTKPLHPQGRVAAGTLAVTDPRPELGVPLFEAQGTHACLVRWSRAAGLPSPLPDVEGLAIRFEEAQADLLLASTGTRAVTRFLLAPRAPGSHGPMTSLLPVASSAGPLLFRVTPVDHDNEPPQRYTLSVACGRGDWHGLGRLEVPEWGPDRPMRFDPVKNLLPGTRQYPLVLMLREPAYLLARRGATPRT